MKASVEILSSCRTGEKSILITSRASYGDRAYEEVDKIRECLAQMNYKVESSCISVNGAYRKAIVSASIPVNMIGNLKQIKEDMKVELDKVN